MVVAFLTVDPRKDVKARCDEIGRNDTVDTDPTATIHREASIRHAGPAVLRELPRIAVDLRGSLSAAGGPPAFAAEGSDLEVVGILGEGGMGRVFLARQHSLDRDVAIKTVRDEALGPERAALLSEGAITGHLEHPAIVPVHALGVDAEGRPVLVMKRVDGVEWTALLEDPRHPAWQGRGGDEHDRLDAHLEILMAVCNAVRFAHGHDVVHRDIKPDNVLIGRYGEVYLADFGVAIRGEDARRPQPLCGTPAYMAPEMALGGPADARTDVYLLGATLHTVLVGGPRHTGRGLHDTLVAAARSAPVAYPPSVPEALAALANAATACAPADRPASAEAFHRALADYLRHRSSIALADRAVERLGKLRAQAGDGVALGSEDQQRDVDLLVAEARFALQQALHGWPGNPDAARAMGELEALLAQRRARAAELERLAHDFDPVLGRRQRAVAVTILALVGAGAVVWGVAGDNQAATPAGLFLQSLGPLVTVALIVVVQRRPALATTFNRRATAALVLAVAGITFSRALGMLAGLRAAQVLVYDALMEAVACAVLAILFRWLWWLPLLMLAASIVAATVPERAQLAFQLAAGVCVVGGAVLAWRKTRGR
jgi:serine/threonine-protein kinase